jgi:hypothetical protein
MPSQPTTAELQNPANQQAPTDQRAEDAQYYRRVLHGFIEIGADLARLLHSQAKSQAETAPPNAGPAPELAPALAPALAPDLAPAFASAFAIAFDRISRAVRRTIMLACKVAEPAAPAAATATQHRAAARRRIIREVEDAIQRTAGPAEAETLHAELVDRLDAPDVDDDIEHRPIADIIADICRDLGLAALPGTHPWKRRTAEDLTALCARAAMPRAAPTRPSFAPIIACPTPPGTRTGSDPPLGSAEPSAG